MRDNNLHVIAEHPKATAKRLLYVILKNREQHLCVMPLLNVNEMRNTRKETKKIVNDFRYLFYADDKMVIRMFQSHSTHKADEQRRNFIEVYNPFGQRMQKSCIGQPYREVVISSSGLILGFLLFRHGEPSNLHIYRLTKGSYYSGCGDSQRVRLSVLKDISTIHKRGSLRDVDIVTTGEEVVRV